MRQERRSERIQNTRRCAKFNIIFSLGTSGSYSIGKLHLNIQAIKSSRSKIDSKVEALQPGNRILATRPPHKITARCKVSAQNLALCRLTDDIVICDAEPRHIDAHVGGRTVWRCALKCRNNCDRRFQNRALRVLLLGIGDLKAQRPSRSRCGTPRLPSGSPCSLPTL